MSSSTETAMTDSWPWPDSLDALVAAPKHHTLILENESVRVVRTYILPGDFVPIHTHRWPGVVHILSWSDFIRRDDKGQVLFDSRSVTPPPKLPAVQYIDPLPPHSVENMGNADIDLYIVELKAPHTK